MTHADCDDGDPSTHDLCAGGLGSCRYEPITGHFDYGVDVTVDSCVANKCSHAGPSVLATQECVVDTDCNDSIVFTADTCVAGECVHESQGPNKIGN